MPSTMTQTITSNTTAHNGPPNSGGSYSITWNGTSTGGGHWDEHGRWVTGPYSQPYIQPKIAPNTQPYGWPNPNQSKPAIIPSPPTPDPVIVEVEVKTCPSCEKTKRVDTEWEENDYICKACRFGE